MIEVVAAVLAGVSAASALVGGGAWWQVRPSRGFWPLLRATQAAAVALAVISGIAVAAGHRPSDGLYWVYALVPIAVGFVAEQLRILSAETVLAARGIPSARDLGKRSDAEQRSVAMAIIRREIGIMALAAAVTCFLALRAIATSHGF